MERLTGRDKSGVYYRHGKESGIHPYADRPPHECVEAIERLADYEDTDLTPEEIKKLQADRDYWKAEALKHCAKLGEIKLLVGRGKNNDRENP